MTTRSNQRRRERALAEFRLRLQSLNAEEVRLMLERRRVRSPERVTMARSRLAELERAARARPPQAWLDGTDGRQIAPAAGPDGLEQAAELPPADLGHAATGISGTAMAVAGQMGRKIGLGAAALAAAALRIARR
jgi:hypothetical protein